MSLLFGIVLQCTVHVQDHVHVCFGVHQIVHFITGLPVLPLAAFRAGYCRVRHDDRGGVIVQIADDHGRGVKFSGFRSPASSMSCQHLIAVFFPWTKQAGDENAMLFDAVGHVKHRFSYKTYV